MSRPAIQPWVMMLRKALQSAAALCGLLLFQIELAFDYLYAHAQSGQSAQTMFQGRMLGMSPNAFLSLDSYCTQACSNYHNIFCPQDRFR